MDSALQLLGLIYKAKKLIFGEEVLNRIDEIKLMIIANDISEKQRIRFEKKCHYYQIDVLSIFSSEQLQNALGKKNVKVIGIIDQGFKKSLLDKI